MNSKEIVSEISRLVKNSEPDATVILYGSYARGDHRVDSDIDVLILLGKDHITPDDEKRVSYPLYALEFETGCIISPLVIGRKDWEKRHRITPFYQNVQREGVVL